MGVDYTNVIMYGKEFDSFDEALAELEASGKLTPEDVEESKEDGNVWMLTDNDGHATQILDWKYYNYFTGGAGVLGECLSANILFTNPEKVTHIKECVDGWLGAGCEIHEFVMVY